MKNLLCLFSCAMIFSNLTVFPANSATYQTSAATIPSEIGNSAQTEITLPKDPTGTPRFVADIKSAEKLVWDSGVEDGKPIDIDKVYISHDVQYINVRMTLVKSLSDVEGDPFVSVAIDTDLNSTTGMPKLHANSFNAGGEDFFARFSTGYGAQKFVIDRWDNGTGDTVETGGLANTKAEGKEIKFSIPRIAIGDPPMLDFKIVARTYQTVDPDLSPDHLAYQLTGTEPVTGWTVEKVKAKTYKITAPSTTQAGISHVSLVWDDYIVPIYRYTFTPAQNPDTVVWSNSPQVAKHLFMTRVEAIEDDENLKFRIDFADSLKGMGDCDLKIWAMLDTDGKVNVGFEGTRFADNYEDFILEVSTESGAVRTKLYTASKGMGYNQPSLNSGTLDPATGICEMLVKKNRIGDPTKIKAKFVCGAFKAIDSDWDVSDKVELPGKLLYLQYNVLASEAPRGLPLDITKVEGVFDTGYLYLRISVKNLDKGNLTVWIDQDANFASGIPATAKNPAGIDNTLELTSKLGSVWRFNPDGAKSKVGDFLGIRYQDGRLHFPVPLKLLSNPKTIRLHVTATDGSDKVASTLWYLQLGQNQQGTCLDQPVVTGEAVNGSVKLSWTSKTEKPLGFYVYKRGDGDTFDRITTFPVTDVSFTDNDVEWGKYYQYKVMLICPDGGKSDLSDTVGVYVKSDKPVAKIQIDKTILDFGQRLQTKNLCDGFTLKNLGPGAVDFKITTTDSKLNATTDSLHVEEGQSKRVNVCITSNLPVGKWEKSVLIETADINISVPVRVEVVPSSASLKTVENLKIDKKIESLVVSWNAPDYNVEQPKSYEITITEFYIGIQKRTYIVSADAGITNITFDKLNFETLYRFSVVPIYAGGPGFSSVAESMPLPSNIYIIVKIGSKEAIVDGKPATVPVPPYVDLKTGKTMVPFRFIAESLHCTVDYDSKTRTITMKRGWKVVKLVIDSNTATTDGFKMNVTPAPTVTKGSTFVPVRFVADAFGAQTTWNATTKQVSIFSPFGYRP